MIRWLFAFAVLPVMALADAVTIRSGEHDTFTRLVLTIGSGTQWNVRPTDGGYFLDLNGDVDGFVTEGVFDRIPRTRLLSVSQSAPTTLFLEVGCDCFADTFKWQSDQLVLDIVDGSDLDDVAVDQTPVLPIITPPPDASQGLPNLLAMRTPLRVAPEQQAMENELQGAPVPAELDATEAALLEGLARAASQGFLDPAVQSSPDVAENSPQDQAAIIIPDLPGPPPRNAQPGVGISTAMDRELSQFGDALQSIVGQQCLPASLFEIDSWADERTFHEQLAALAEGLAGEFGEEPREAQDQLARLYLHFGFGAEARAVLSADPALSQSRQVLVELAGIIDDYPGTYDLIEAQAGCSTPAAIWAFYLNPGLLDEEARNYILQQFFSLPQPMRGQIAPRLARKFVEIGDADAASKLLRASENQDSGATHDVQAARALVAEEYDDPEQAIEVLAQEAGDNARTAPESLIRLIDLALEQGLKPSEEDLTLAASMRQEYRALPIANDLGRAEAQGRFELGQYREALSLMDGRVDEEAQAVVNGAFAHLARFASAAEFLEFAYGDIPAAVTAQTENDIAARLIDLGFPDRARVLLSGPAEREAASERRYLRAEAAIGTQDYDDVIDQLRGMSDPRARELRARAYTGLGEFRSALAASDPEQPSETSEALQFRAGAWERLSDQENSALSSFAEAVLAPPVAVQPETLADRRALLAQSQESRRAIEGLLLRFDGTSPQD